MRTIQPILILALTLAACGGGAPPAPHEAPHGAPPAAAAHPEPEAPAQAAGTRQDVDMATFIGLRAEGVTVIDVRTPGEYEAGHVPGAVLVPLQDLTPDHPALAAVDKSKPVYFVCQSGGRSARAADQMSKAGYHAVNVLGGTGAWVAAGQEVEQ